MSLDVSKWFDEDLEVAEVVGGAIAGTCDLSFGAGSSTVKGSGKLAGSAANVFGAGSSTLKGAGKLAGTSANVFGHGSSTLKGAGKLQGATPMVFDLTSALGAGGDIMGAAAMAFGGSATLKGTGSLLGVVPMEFLNNGILTGDQGQQPQPAVAPTGGTGGRRLLRKKRFSVQIDGQFYVFDDLDSLIAFLSKHEEEEVEATEAVAERDAKRIVLVGREKVRTAPPKVSIQSAVQEIREYAADVQARIERVYWKALAAALAREAEEAEDVAFIATLDL